MLIIEKKPKEGFRKIAEQGSGLCISRFHPVYLRERYNMDNVELHWLSELEGENTIRPDELEKVLNIVSRFAKRHNDAKVLFDGIEYLLLYNGCQNISEFLKKLEQLSSNMHFTVMIHLDPDVLGASVELYEIFAPYFTPQQEEALRQTFQVEPNPVVQTVVDR